MSVTILNRLAVMLVYMLPEYVLYKKTYNHRFGCKGYRKAYLAQVRVRQTTFSDIEYGNRKHTTKREEFLDIMNEIIPWEEWVEFVHHIIPPASVADR